MHINKNDLISGFPIKVIRDFLRKYEHFTKDTFSNFCFKIIKKREICTFKKHYFYIKYRSIDERIKTKRIY